MYCCEVVLLCTPGWTASSSARTTPPWSSSAGQSTARHAAQHLGEAEAIVQSKGFRLQLQGGFQRPACSTALGKGRCDSHSRRSGSCSYSCSGASSWRPSVVGDWQRHWTTAGCLVLNRRSRLYSRAGFVSIWGDWPRP